ncbi:MAG TPA: hypothetical protein VF911_10840, partial [Thermoanaerobaculia bacterium]
MTTTENLPTPATERATLPILDSAAVARAAEEAIGRARELLAKIEALPLERASVESVLDAWDETAIVLEDAFGPISLLNSVHPDKDVRDACDDALLHESSFLTDVFQNEAFYERVARVAADSMAAREMQKQLVEAFEDSGVSLAPEKRKRFKEISDRLTELGQEF